MGNVLSGSLKAVMIKKVFSFFLILLFVFISLTSFSDSFSPLAEAPNWNELAVFHETITQEAFLQQLEKIYLENPASLPRWVEPGTKGVLLRKTAFSADGFFLKFASSAQTQKPLPSLPKIFEFKSSTLEPLKGLRIAIDPGHLGGSWARMEERWFQLHGFAPIAEGDLTLKVAKILKEKLIQKGAEATLVRSGAQPLTHDRPETLKKVALKHLEFLYRTGLHPEIQWPLSMQSAAVSRESEILFYRTSEIRARARYINQTTHPDLVLCLHFNAENWGDPTHPVFASQNHFHLILNGNYTDEELEYEDIRFEMFKRLLSGYSTVEKKWASPVASRFAKETGLPSPLYAGAHARRSPENSFVWMRNLLANRLYEAPVLYFEPYLMNHPLVYERILMGDYPGLRRFQGKEFKSIFQEYADAVVAGLEDAVLGHQPESLRIK